jgi:integrase
MELLRSGVDRSVVALWLGHESVETSQMYFHADMGMKEQALAHSSPTGLKPKRFDSCRLTEQPQCHEPR